MPSNRYVTYNSWFYGNKIAVASLLALTGKNYTEALADVAKGNKTVEYV